MFDRRGWQHSLSRPGWQRQDHAGQVRAMVRDRAPGDRRRSPHRCFWPTCSGCARPLAKASVTTNARITSAAHPLLRFTCSAIGQLVAGMAAASANSTPALTRYPPASAAIPPSPSIDAATDGAIFRRNTPRSGSIHSLGRVSAVDRFCEYSMRFTRRSRTLRTTTSVEIGSNTTQLIATIGPVLPTRPTCH